MKENQIPATDRFISGWLGGSCSVLLTHPLDTLRVRLQSGQRIAGHGSMANHLYRGLGPPLLGIGPIMATLFVSYEGALRLLNLSKVEENKMDERLEKVLRRDGEDAENNRQRKRQEEENQILKVWQTHAMAGCLAALPTAVIGIPGERLKILLQLSQVSATSTSKPMTFIEGIYLMHAQGFRHGWYRGAAVTLMRDMPATGIWFGTYQSVRAFFRQMEAKASGDRSGMNPLWSSPLLATSVSGALAAWCQWTVTMPLDTIKTRLQMNRMNPGSGVTLIKERVSVRQVIMELLAERRGSGIWHTVRIFYRGYLPAVARAVPGSVASWLGTEATLNLLARYRGEKK